MPLDRGDVLRQLGRMNALLLAAAAELRATPARGYDSRKRRDVLVQEWTDTLDEILALRLRAYSEGIELPPLFPGPPTVV